MSPALSSGSSKLLVDGDWAGGLLQRSSNTPLLTYPLTLPWGASINNVSIFRGKGSQTDKRKGLKPRPCQISAEYDGALHRSAFCQFPFWWIGNICPISDTECLTWPRLFCSPAPHFDHYYSLWYTLYLSLIAQSCHVFFWLNLDILNQCTLHCYVLPRSRPIWWMFLRQFLFTASEVSFLVNYY